MTSPSPKSRDWLLYVSVWTLAGLFWATRGYWIWKDNPEFPLSWTQAMILGLIEWYLWGILALFIFWVCVRLPFQRSNWWKPLGIHLGVALAVSLVHLFVYIAIDRPIDAYFMKGKTFPEMEFFWPAYFFVIRSRIHSTVLVYALIAMISYAIIYYRQYREKELHAAELSTQLASAELQVLKAQLHPHFLFNTLHSISSLMHEDIGAADRMLSRLSELLRVVLSNEGRQTVSLRQEVEFLEAYLEIERVRFSDRLRAEVSVDPGTLDAEIPSLLLQPLVENAIRHGIASRTEGGKVQFTALRDNGQLRLTIADDGKGLGTGESQSSGRGIGLANVRERLWRLYGDSHTFSLNTSDSGVTVTIAIPYREVGRDK